MLPTCLPTVMLTGSVSSLGSWTVSDLACAASELNTGIVLYRCLVRMRRRLQGCMLFELIISINLSGI